MTSGIRFWRNVAIIGVFHVALLVGLIRWSTEKKLIPPADVVWLDTSALAASVALSAAPSPAEAAEPQPEEEPPPLVAAEEQPPPPPLASEIVVPAPTPEPTPTPESTPPPPSPTATAAPKPSPRTTATPRPKRALLAKATPTPRPAATPRKVAEKRSTPAPRPAAAPAAPSTGTAARSGAPANSPEIASYRKRLHDRFYSAWQQPTTPLPAGSRMSALVQIRIERDGRVTGFNIVRPSGNVVVDDSVAAVARRVGRVDPLPEGLGNGPYEVKINFELNPEQ
jgi:periplasmic protein TonB